MAVPADNIICWRPELEGRGLGGRTMRYILVDGGSICCNGGGVPFAPFVGAGSGVGSTHQSGRFASSSGGVSFAPVLATVSAAAILGGVLLPAAVREGGAGDDGRGRQETPLLSRRPPHPPHAVDKLFEADAPVPVHVEVREDRRRLLRVGLRPRGERNVVEVNESRVAAVEAVERRPELCLVQPPLLYRGGEELVVVDESCGNGSSSPGSSSSSIRRGGWLELEAAGRLPLPLQSLSSKLGLPRGAQKTAVSPR